VPPPPQITSDIPPEAATGSRWRRLFGAANMGDPTDSAEALEGTASAARRPDAQPVSSRRATRNRRRAWIRWPSSFRR
jgi:hypothetical protein